MSAKNVVKTMKIQLKNESLIHTCNNVIELKQLVQQSIKTYNNKRSHLSLNYKTSSFIHNKKTCEASFTGVI
ncbi:hypothetical protein IWQ47_004328 [Aquimarina sp. EL_43]|nr:hypothetical protein [Aquimarina sp. EL_35]MBG6153081.1 hypothetical protein [Aquimarina sp. EL_32]MBG6171237.1 hypothetical protein [Aquimarina sp. EL_43]